MEESRAEALDPEQDLQIVRRGGRGGHVVGVRQRDSDLAICRKKSFNVETDALRAIGQMHLMAGQNTKPTGAYKRCTAISGTSQAGRPRLRAWTANSKTDKLLAAIYQLTQSFSSFSSWLPSTSCTS